MEIYYTFQNTHAVILAEKVLLSAGILVKVRPIPSVISAGCGMCLCVLSECREYAESEMKKNSVEFLEIYIYENGQFNLLNV